MRNQPSLNRLIPVTELRHFYRALRRFESEAFHRQTALECLRRPDELADLVAASSQHFSLYDNRHEGFHDRPQARSLTTARSASGQLANTLVQQIAVESVQISAARQFEFRFVDYEISPIRTTKSVFETGESSQRGRGGIDLLLSNCHDQTPIVGEVKADTDRNPFLGLIQSLNYAVELATESQLDRLNRHYPDCFRSIEGGPGIDIHLLLLRYPTDSVSQDFLNLTDQVSARLLSSGSPVSGLIRRIVGFHCPMSADSPRDFTIAFSHGR